MLDFIWLEIRKTPVAIIINCGTVVKKEIVKKEIKSDDELQRASQETQMYISGVVGSWLKLFE